MAIDLGELYDLYPFASHTLNVDDQRMHYVDEGAGEPILLLHGNPTWSFYYRKLILGLRHRYRLIAPDHIGCGLSDKPRRYPYTLSTHIRNLESLIDHLGLSGVTLAVHDWGGPIGLGWAVRHPHLVRRLIIFNSAAFPGPCPLRLRVCGLPVLGDLLVRGLNLFVRGALRMACVHRERLGDRVRRVYLMPYDSFAHRVAILRFVEDIPLHPGMTSYRLIKTIERALPQFRDRPTLICWGMRDFCFNAHFLERWRTLFPQAQAHRYEDAGHYVLEDAHERILPAVAEFLMNDSATHASAPGGG